MMDLLGGSVFTEDYCDQWTEVESAISTASQQLENRTADQLIVLQLLNAVLQALRGNLRHSKETLEGRLEDVEYSEFWELRLKTWHTFVALLRRFPPLIRFRPELGGIMAVDRMQTLAYFQTYMDLNDRLTNYHSEGMTLEEFEGQVVLFLLGYPLCLWTSAFTQHPAYPHGSWTANRPEAAQNISNSKKILSWLRSIATANGIHGLNMHLERLEAELVACVSVGPSSNVFGELAAGYEAEENSIRAGVAKLLEADHRLSPPFSNPIAFNLIPIDTNDVGTLNIQWDATEDRLQLVDDLEAQKLYQDALACFDRAGTERGQAAVALRQGCLLHIQACDSKLSFTERQTKLESARHKFEASQAKVGQDGSHMTLIQGHQLLLHISSGDARLQDLRQDARRIGNWGCEMHNEGISHFIGWLMMRFGRRQLLACSLMRVALQCYRCARDLFLGLGDEIAAFQAAVAEMQLYDSYTNNVTARSFVDEQLPIFRRITSRILEEYTLSSKPDMQLLLRHNIILTYGSLLSQAYRYAGDTDALSRWKEERYRLHHHQETQRVLRATVKIPYLQENVIGNTLTEEERNTIFEDAQEDQAGFDLYHEADAKCQLSLLDNELERGETIFRTFIEDIEGGNCSLYVKSLLKLYASFQLGWTGKARQHLDTIPDEKLYDSGVQKLEPIDKIWWRPHYSVALRSAESCENAIAFCALAQKWNRGLAILNSVQNLYPGYLDLDHGERISDPWSRLTWAALIEEHSGLYFQAFRHLLAAAKSAELHRANGIDIDSKVSTFSVRSTAELFASLARLCLRCHESGIPLQAIDSGDHQHPFAESWIEHALIFLEQANARALLDTLSTLGEDNEAQSKARQKQVLRRRTQLRALSAKQRTVEETSELANIDNLLESGDQESGEGFIPNVKLDMNPRSWCSAVEEDAVVLYWKFCRYGSLAFAITSLGITIQGVDKQDIRDVDIRKPVMDVMRELKNYGQNMDSSGKASLEATLKELSSHLIDPFRDVISQKKRIIFVCSQPLGMFPFGALLLGGKPLAVQKIISQVPSLMLLEHLRRSRVVGELASPQFSAIVKANGTKDGRDLMIEPPLPMAGIEALASARLFGTVPLNGSNVNRQDFMAEFQRADIMLLATHGTLDYRSPMLSSISLSEKLRVIDVVRCSKAPALILFAACLSGLGSATATNDITSFSQSLLSNGCKAFVGALWRVNDISTMFFTTLFFQHLHKADGKVQLDEIFHSVQKELFCMTLAHAKAHIQDLLNTWTLMLKEGKNPQVLVKKGSWYLKKALEKLEDVDWTHPFHFASMALVGDGSMKFC